MIEGDLIEGFLELETTQTIVDKGLFRQEMQVLLERFPDEFAFEASEEGLLGGLALEHGEHAPGDTHDGEVLIVVQVLVRAECQNAPNRLQVLIIFVAILAITRDIHAINVSQFTHQLSVCLHIVDWHDASSTCLQEIGMRSLKEAFVGELEVVVPLGGERLGEHSDDRLICLGSHMVAPVFEHGFALMAAQVVRLAPLALC